MEVDRMVNVTHDWGAFTKYSEHCRVGTYSVQDHQKGKEIRVSAGRLGYIAILDEANETQKQIMDEILNWCEIQGFIRIEGTITDELFHA